MTENQIIKLWKLGYSKRYIHNLEYDDMKRDFKLRELTAKEMKHKSLKKVERVLLNEYYKTKSLAI